MSRKSEVDPVVTDSYFEGTRSDHPAFGQISANRVSGHTTLYGSDFIHNNYISIRLYTSSLDRSLSEDRYFSGRELFEVNLSEAQWATFVSAMNVGFGVPCTIDHVMGEQKPGIPLRKQENQFKAEIKNDLLKAEEALKDLREKIIALGLINKKAIPLLEEVAKASRAISDGIPFVTDQFDEHVQTTMEKAKVELHGYMQSVFSRAGIAAITQVAPLMLENKTDEK